MTACRHKHNSWAKSIFPVQLVHCKGGDASLETEAKTFGISFDEDSCLSFEVIPVQFLLARGKKGTRRGEKKLPSHHRD